jgi:hypothetical protein
MSKAMSFHPNHSFLPAELRARTRLVMTGAAICLALTSCSTGKVTSVKDFSTAAARPAVVYVADFDLAPNSVQSGTPTAALPIHAYLEQSKAQSLIPTMSAAIVQDLTKKGIAAERLPANSPRPKQGWLVRGTFMEVNEGDRLKRAIIGFGSGHTDIEVAATTDDLSAGAAAAPLFQAQTEASSNRLPGAAVTLNPYMAAARYLLAGHDLDRGTRDTAEKIADAVAARVKGSGSSS